MGEYMIVKELYDALSPYQEIQIGDSKTGEPITYVSYRQGVCKYDRNKVYGIAPKVDKKGKPFLAILVELDDAKEITERSEHNAKH